MKNKTSLIILLLVLHISIIKACANEDNKGPIEKRRNVASGPKNLIPIFRKSMENHVTLGEISFVLEDIFQRQVITI